jgi:hydroxyacylglutathione hydrolase
VSTPGSGASVTVLATPELGDRSYLVSDGGVAAVIDPQRDVERVLAAAAGLGVRVSDVVETHVHNDYVSGGLHLARTTGARYWVGADEEVSFERSALHDGGRVAVGSLALRAVSTPGHTPTHLSLVLEREGRPSAVFSGGSLLYGSVGRTDLTGPERTVELARAQLHSVRRLASLLPAEAAVYPTHGFGSFCSSTPASGASASTIGDEIRANPTLTAAGEEDFVASLLGGLTAHPRYYAEMAPINRAGPPPWQPDGHRILDLPGMRTRIDAGEWVVDVRERRPFAAAHLRGTVSVELSEQLTTHLGWAIRWGTTVSLIAPSAGAAAEAARRLALIGIDDLGGVAIGAVDELGAQGGELVGYPVATFADLAAARRHGLDPLVLDVRRPDEWALGHLAGALHIPFYDVEARAPELPPGAETWVHCARGQRAALAASLLHRAGGRPVLIDDLWDHVEEAGLEVLRS